MRAGRNRSIALLVVAAGIGWATPLFAPGADLSPAGGMGNGQVPSNVDASIVREGESDTLIRLVIQCFGTNLRPHQNVASRNGHVEARFTIAGIPQVVVFFNLQYVVFGQPGNTAADGIPRPSYYYGGAFAGQESNHPLQVINVNGRIGEVHIRLRGFQNLRTTWTYGDPNPSLTVFPMVVTAHPLYYQRHVPGYEEYMAQNGLLENHAAGSFTPLGPSDPYTLSTFVGYATFLGELGFCGSYISPLMLFFDEKRPAFTGKARFRMQGEEQELYWMEPGAPGFFLALDRNHDGIINDGGELFGNRKDRNGFESLRALDTHKDDRIDSRDKQFSELILWRDANGDGVSQRDELTSVQRMGVKSISLKYKTGHVEEVAGKVALRERAPFVFVAAGKEKTGEVIDVWFEQVPRRMVSTAVSYGPPEMHLLAPGLTRSQGP